MMVSSIASFHVPYRSVPLRQSATPPKYAETPVRFSAMDKETFRRYAPISSILAGLALMGAGIGTLVSATQDDLQNVGHVEPIRVQIQQAATDKALDPCLVYGQCEGFDANAQQHFKAIWQAYETALKADLPSDQALVSVIGQVGQRLSVQEQETLKQYVIQASKLEYNETKDLLDRMLDDLLMKPATTPEAKSTAIKQKQQLTQFFERRQAELHQSSQKVNRAFYPLIPGGILAILGMFTLPSRKYEGLA